MENRIIVEEALNPKPFKDQLVYLGNKVLEGEINPLEASIALKQMEAIIADVKAQIKDAAVEESSKWTVEPFRNNAGKIEMRNGATRYSFKHIEKWVEKKKELAEIEALAKTAARSNSTFYDDQGEEVEKAIASGGAPVIAITLKA